MGVARTLRQLGAVAVTTAVVMTGAGGAWAQTRSFSDAAGDSGRAPDIRTVDVSYAKALRIQAHHVGPKLSVTTSVTYWLDTRRRDKGPEYRAFAVPNSDSFGLLRVEGWKSKGTPVKCRGLRMRADIFDQTRTLTLRAPGRCIGDPPRVRVAVRVLKHGKGGPWRDWAPAAFHFYGWVGRG